MKKHLLSCSIALSLTGVLGCSEPQKAEPAASKPVAAAPKAAPKKAEAPAAPAMKIPADAIALTGDITFVGRKVIGSHDFVFKTWKGYAALNDGAVAGGNLGFEIKTESVVADEGNRSKWTPKLEKHMKDPDFFDVAKFPTATFTSSEITATPGKPDAVTVTGLLTIKGIAKTVTFPATVRQAEGKLSAEAALTINRQDFGIAYPGKPDNLIQDDVVITIKVNG